MNNIKEEQKENLDNIKPKKLKENNKSKSDNELIIILSL